MEEEEEEENPTMLDSDSFWDDEGSLHEAQEELFADQDCLETSEDEGESEDEEEEGLTGEYKAKESEIFLTSTECKRSPIKSIGREAVEGLGLCFVSPISKDYEEPEPGEREDIWDNFIKTGLSLSSQCPEDDSTNLGSSFSHPPSRSPVSDYQRSSSTPSPSLLEKLVEKTRAVCVTKLTNIEFWVQHFEAIVTEVLMEDADTDLSPSLILQYLETMNDHFTMKFPSVFPRDRKKNCFPKLADILIKRLPIIFGDYLNTED